MFMDRTKLFEEFLAECKNRKEWSGQGNPNADILIIGKEPHNNKKTIVEAEFGELPLVKEIPLGAIIKT